MSTWKGPRPWWIAAALAPALLVGLWLLMEARVPPPRASSASPLVVLLEPRVRLVLLFILLLAAPALLWRTGLRRAEPPAERIEARVMETIGHAQEARRAVQEALAALAQADARGAGGQVPTSAPRRVGRATLALAAVVLFLVASGGLAYAFLQVPDENVPSSTELFHIHPTFAVYVHGQRIDYSDPAFDLSERGYLRSHLHVDDPDVMHVEIVRGQTLGGFLERATGTGLGIDVLVLDELVHGGARHESGVDGLLRVFVAPDRGDAWKELDNAPSHVLRDGDRILITYGHASDEELAAQKASVQVGVTG